MFANEELWDATKLKKKFKKHFKLIDVALGSIHYDQELKKNKKFCGELIFDLRMSQKIKFQIQIDKMSCLFKEQMTSVNYFYNFLLTVQLEGQQDKSRKLKFQDIRQSQLYDH